jgi:hypothetical protein
VSIQPFQFNVLRSLKWQQQNAPNLTSLLTQKSNWYAKYQNQFWQQWTANVFDLRTAQPFGILIWCIILGVPSQLFGLYGNSRAWAYGPKRENYVYSGPSPAPSGENVLGGNYAGGGNTSILNIQEARWALQLRYASLVSNGRIAYINKMLNWIFNNGQPWDFAAGQYFYVNDCTAAEETLPAFQLKYHVGPNMTFSGQFLNLLNTPKYGIMPTTSGSSYTVVVDP